MFPPEPLILCLPFSSMLERGHLLVQLSLKTRVGVSEGTDRSGACSGKESRRSDGVVEGGRAPHTENISPTRQTEGIILKAGQPYKCLPQFMKPPALLRCLINFNFTTEFNFKKICIKFFGYLL